MQFFFITLMILSSCLFSFPSGRIVESPAIETTRKLNRLPVGLSFPPVASPAEVSSTIRYADTLGVKDVRFSTSWSLREPSLGVYSFSGLDYRIDSLHNAGIKIFLTIESDGPAWRCGVKNARSCVYTDLQAFRVYVDTLVKRYQGKLSYIQFGNESFSSYWYVGNALEFVNAANVFYEAVKAADPALPVVLAGVQISAVHAIAVCQAGRAIPSRTGNGVLITSEAFCADPVNQEMINRFAVITTGAKYDFADVHLYDNMEYWFDYVESIRSFLPGVSLLSSEIGMPSKRYEPADDAYHATRFGVMLRTVPTLDLKLSLYFKLKGYDPAENAEHENSSLLRFSDGSKKPAFDSLRIYNNEVLP